MTTSADQISVVLSGGTTNINPNESLGGDPSSAPITSGIINNLFDDISPDEGLNGHEDYRCIYIFNDGDTAIYNIKVWISSDFDDGSVMELGIENRDESQRITLDGGIITGGSLTLSYKLTEFTTNYHSDLSDWAEELQDILTNLLDSEDNNYFDEVTVIAQTAGSNTIIFDIQFSGFDGSRNHDKFEEVSNDLTANNPIAVFITAPQEGAPINTIAPEINIETTPPGGVGFFAASETSPINLAHLEPDEGFPLWIKRTTPEDTVAKEQDGFIMRFSAESLRP